MVVSVAYSPDGKTLASANVYGNIMLWDLVTEKEKATLRGHTGCINSVTFSPDGKTLASAGDDRTIILWDIPTTQEIKKENESAPQEQQKEPPKEFTNSIGMKFVWIPPGNFQMGSPKEEKVRQNHETQHKVTLTKGFYMGVYTVTHEQWKNVMGNNPSFFKGEKNLPVENLSWEDCQEFIKKLGEKDKKEYRLPTEAEWEYACRAGTTTPFHFGETISTDQANYNGNMPYGNGKKGKFQGRTTPVGSFPANAFGLYDMHGNVWQWCQDWYGEYPQKDVIDPQGPDAGQCRVLRGGSFVDQAKNMRSAARASAVPTHRYNFNGFRVARTFTADEAKQDTPPAKDTKEGQKQIDEAKTKAETKMEKKSGFLQLDREGGVDLEKGTITGIERLGSVFGNQLGDKWVITVKQITKIIYDGKSIALADLPPLIEAGYPQFFVEWETERVVDQSNLQATKKGNAIRIDTRRREGEVPIKSLNLTKNTITILTNILTSDGKYETHEREVTEDVEVEINGRPAKFADLKPNMQVRLSTTLHKESKLFGRHLVVSIEASGQKVNGVIRAVDSAKRTIAVHLPYAQMTTEHVPVAAYSKVVIDGKDGKLSDLKAGMRVTLQMSAELDESLIVGITKE